MTSDGNNRVYATGSCNCGAVKFEVTQALDSVFVCHCSICRKSTGSGGIAVTVVPEKALNITQGQAHITQWRKPGHDWLTNFCDCCGSPLPGENDAQHQYIPVGVLDSGAEQLQVKHHLFTDSKAPWEHIGGPGKIHPEQYKP